MTDIISIAPARASAIRLPRLRVPLQGLALAFGSMCRMFGRAMEQAYVTPYNIAVKHEAPLPDSGQEGRDPRW